MELILLLTIILVVTISFSVLAVYILIVLIYTKVPFVRTPTKVINTILDENIIKPNHTVYDLGCGSAKFLIAIEKNVGAKTIGYEISPWAYFLAKMNTWLRKSKTKVHYKNFYKENLTKADIVFCFLLDSVMPKVKKQLEQQLKKGSTVISFAFPIKDWEPKKLLNPFPNKKKSSKIYIYQI